MKRCDVLALVLLLSAAASPLAAAPAEMNKALDAWNQQMTEYHAAVRHLQSAEQKAAVQLPDPDRVAPALWKAISGKTGQREVRVQPTPEERMQGKEPGVEKRPAYEFEEEWAAPAVMWFVNHPQALAKLFEGKPRQLSFFADALLDAIERRHYMSALVAEAVAMLTEGANSRSYNILEKIYTRNQDPVARGYAALGMSIMLGNPLVAAEAGSPAMARGKRVYYLKQALALTPEDARFGSSTVSDIVLEQSYRLKHLSVGSIPPRVQLKDQAGKALSLPAPGKPTLLLFWNPAEAVSAEMARKLPTLKQKYPELQLAAITPAPATEEAKQALEECGVEAYCVDDAKGSAGTAYRITQLPTAVLLGERCHVLYIGFPDMHLQAALSSCFQAGASAAGAARVQVAEQPAGQQVMPPATVSGMPADEALSPPAGGERGSDEAPALRDMPEF